MHGYDPGLQPCSILKITSVHNRLTGANTLRFSNSYAVVCATNARLVMVFTIPLGSERTQDDGRSQPEATSTPGSDALVLRQKLEMEHL